MKKYQVAIIGTNIGAKHYEDFQKVSDTFLIRFESVPHEFMISV